MNRIQFTLILLNVILENTGLPLNVMLMNFHFTTDDMSKPKLQRKRIGQDYLKLIEENMRHQNTQHGANLIIFPELVLESSKQMEAFSIEANWNENVCHDTKASYPMSLRRIACAAITTNTTIVMSLLHKKSEGNFYPTDIVIDCTGKIKLINHRESQVGNHLFNHMPIPFEIPATRKFTICNGVPFFSVTSAYTGFKFSTKQMVFDPQKEKRIYIVTSSWISQMPFLTCLQVYQMISQELGVTIIVSSANNPKEGQGGIGVFHETAGPLLMEYAFDTRTTTYIYCISEDNETGTVEPILRPLLPHQQGKRMDRFKMEADPDLTKYASVLLDTSQAHIVTTVCYNDDELNNNLCCNFDIKFKTKNYYQIGTRYVYHLVAYKDYKTYYSLFDRGGVEVCAIVACLESTVSSCGKRFSNYDYISWPVRFSSIVIQANFTLSEKFASFPSAQFPNSLLSTMLPIHPNETNWTRKVYESDGLIERTFETKSPQRLLTFGIFGRNFNMKTRGPENGSSSSLHGGFVAFLIISLCVVFFNKM